MFSFLLPLFLSFVASWAMTGLVRKKLLARAVMDIPNERSMHKVPVPRGGGLAVMIVIVAGLVISLFTPLLPVSLSTLSSTSVLGSYSPLPNPPRKGEGTSAGSRQEIPSIFERWGMNPVCATNNQDIPSPLRGGLGRGGAQSQTPAVCPVDSSFISTLLLLTGIALLMFVSWLDDKKGMGVKIRLSTHLAAALIGSFALDPEAMALGGLLPLWLDRALIVIGWAWFMNLYNFMDGIDGITGVESLSCAAGAALLFLLLGMTETNDVLLPALLIGSSLGFLMLNWHPAKIFLGDVGSVPLGFLVGFLCLRLACAGHPAAALLLPFYYLADSGITIAKRALRREKIWQAHREHFYQRATVATHTPVPVLLWIALANAGLIGCAAWALNAPWLGLALGVGMVVLLLAKMSHTARKALPK